MSKQLKTAIVLFFSFVFIFFGISQEYLPLIEKAIEEETFWPQSKIDTKSEAEYTVTRVIDGDTIVVSQGDKSYRVRYIGVDTPELSRDNQVAECLADEARAFNEELVLGQVVRLEKDISETDKYDRLLRYVYVNDVLVNAELLSSGFATILTIPPDVARAEDFKALEREAREEKRGLWGELCN